MDNKNKQDDDGTITVYEYWQHEQFEVKLRKENFEKYIEEIGKARARFNERKKRKEKERKDKDKE
jgi:hypothetical protein